MVAAIFAILFVIAAIAGLNWYVCTTALLLYMHGKEYTPPNSEEMKACLSEAWKKTLKIK